MAIDIADVIRALHPHVNYGGDVTAEQTVVDYLSEQNVESNTDDDDDEPIDLVPVEGN